MNMFLDDIAYPYQNKCRGLTADMHEVKIGINESRKTENVSR